MIRLATAWAGMFAFVLVLGAGLGAYVVGTLSVVGRYVLPWAGDGWAIFTAILLILAGFLATIGTLAFWGESRQ